MQAKISNLADMRTEGDITKEELCFYEMSDILGKLDNMKKERENGW